MRIVTIVGARPQFVKAAAVSRIIRKEIEEILVHTGQHYDENMSEIFFEELEIPKPDYNLGVGSGTHANQTAEMLIGIEEILIKEKPDAILLYGDTNSTLAGALAAAKLNIPIAHVEAGLRSYVKDMPEEQNRIVTDHLSKWNFVPSKDGMKCLKEEGLEKTSYFVGDVMYDSLLYYGEKSELNGREYYLNNLKLVNIKDKENIKKLNDGWYLATVHRPENTDEPQKYIEILSALNELDYLVILPVHPRTKKILEEYDLINKNHNILFVEPLGYIDIIFFNKHAKKVITDSGGLHKESYLMKVPGIVILRNTGWVETLEGNWNVLASPDKKDILRKVNNTKINKKKWGKHYGDGNAAGKILEVLLESKQE